MRSIFPVAECPDDITVFNWIRSQTDIADYEASMQPEIEYPEIIKIAGLGIDYPAMAEYLDAITAVAENKIDGWVHKDRTVLCYTGFSFVHNPDHLEGPEPLVSTFGTQMTTREEATYGESLDTKVKNSYYDTYSFRFRTPESQSGPLGDFLDGLRRTLIRSRSATYNAMYSPNPRIRDQSGWHRDESIFCNLRINIPITTDQIFRFQMEGSDDVWLETGYGYTFDANRMHRAYGAALERKKRTHIILGISCWFDYDHEADAFVVNEFYGKVHPFDMVRKGLIHPQWTVGL